MLRRQLISKEENIFSHCSDHAVSWCDRVGELCVPCGGEGEVGVSEAQFYLLYSFAQG